MTPAEEFAAIKSTLREKGYDLADLERTCLQGGLMTDEVLIVSYFRLLSPRVFVTPVAEVRITQNFKPREVLESIFHQITGKKRSFKQDPYVEFDQAMQGTDFNLIIVVDKGIGLNPADPEICRFANVVRSMNSHRGVKVVAFCEDKFGIPGEIGRNLTHLRAKK